MVGWGVKSAQRRKLAELARLWCWQLTYSCKGFFL